MGKLAMLREREPSAQLLIVSSTGFTNEVRERAKATRIWTLTYEELFTKFEKFEPYVSAVLDSSGLGTELAALNEVYEEPQFADEKGSDTATEYLSKWRDGGGTKPGWLVITGEYGTGKTALTKILQYRWLREYHLNPSLPLPFRMELRDFSRQFDASGLIHHFLDHNHLGHLPLSFVLSLIRTGRVVLILDGYDEMAQYLHARERRACLEALAELSEKGAKGILTSRPNYFTETEELQVFEILYASLEHGQYYMGPEEKALVERERRVDTLLEQFVYRFERILQDLTPDQTENLVGRILKKDETGKNIILGILRSIFRNVDVGQQALSGKPVIISYLLEVIEALKEESVAGKRPSVTLTEWQVYQLIVDKLMLRDLRRSPELGPDERRSFLHRLSMVLSNKEHPTLHEEGFRDLVAKEFTVRLRRSGPDSRQQELEKLFADLRSSGTLTRSSEPSKEGWRFSHNSLREFLVAEYLVSRLSAGVVVPETVLVSDAMRLFVNSRSQTETGDTLRHLSSSWQKDRTQRGLGTLLSLLWDALLPLFTGKPDPSRACLTALQGQSVSFQELEINRIRISSELSPTDLSGTDFVNASLIGVDLTSAVLRGSRFIGAVLEDTNLSAADLRECDFAAATLVDVILSDASIQGASFCGIDPSYISIIVDEPNVAGQRQRLEGHNALGYLRYHGGKTDKLSNAVVLVHHPRFHIVKKVLQRLTEQTLRQRRGLEQRGAAREDVPFARDLLSLLEKQGWLSTPVSRTDLVELTASGREALSTFKTTGEVPRLIEEFLAVTMPAH
jgi:hypothetical protein